MSAIYFLAMFDAIRYLLLQVRSHGDPMAHHEVVCFATHLRCDPSRISVHDLISGPPSKALLDDFDVVLLGGSGDYSVVTGGPWLEPSLECMRQLHDLAKPTFASCWGFQAFSLALGGTVVTDLNRAEVGGVTMWLTEEGRNDPVFGRLGDTFVGQMGHQDIVDRLPDGAIGLASSDRVVNQAFHFPGLPIYGTQFHPELGMETLLDRLRFYPAYIEQITGFEYDTFVRRCCGESPATETLLERFLQHVFGD